MSKNTSEILIVGNCCHDTLINRQGRFEVLGGSASYISAALKDLETPFRAISKVGKDFLYGEQVPLAPLVSSTRPTTHFLDDTTSGKRRSALLARCEEIRPSDIGHAQARIAIASGIAMEITPELLIHLRSIAETVICDAQGLIRATDGEGRVIHRPIAETPFERVIGSVDYLKVSEDEARAFDFARLPESLTVLLTRGGDGCELIRGGRVKRFPGFPADEVDPTGAGDCFVAGFARALALAMPPERAAVEANRIGAIAVGQVGVPKFRPECRQGA